MTNRIKTALDLPSGARFYRCALQVNPFEYLGRHSRTSAFEDEASYNNAIVAKCKELGIEAIGVTDHYRIRSSAGLIQTARDRGLHVFLGFEAVTKDGVHFLCLFDPSTECVRIERIIGDCGVHDQVSPSPLGSRDALELLECIRNWGGACIAAHMTLDGGILVTLSGQTAIQVWRSPFLLSGAIPGSVDDLPMNYRQIVQNKNSDFKRQREIAIVNAGDVDNPDDLEQPGASCWIKMSEVSVEGLRQAFLDPQSRIRLASDLVSEAHTELLAIAWESGFLDGAGIHFNENLNALVGGRGTGKSTVVESIRYAIGMEPLADDAKRVHANMVKDVLKSGTKISLLVRSHKPKLAEYLIERTVPNPPTVKDSNGRLLNVTPGDIIPSAEVYGQHEISEIARDPKKRTSLLDRFVERDPSSQQRKTELMRELQRSRARILEIQRELESISERLASLPVLEEMLKRFEEAGLEEKLKEQSLLVREERIIQSASERLQPFVEILEETRRQLPIDRTFISQKVIAQLPGKDHLASIHASLERLSKDLQTIANQMEQALKQTSQTQELLRSEWEEKRKRPVEKEYERILRDLQKTRLDGQEFIDLRRQIENLTPLKERKVELQRNLEEAQEHRRKLLTEWEDMKAEEYRQLDRAAKKVSKQLGNRVRVQVDYAGNREPLFQLLRQVSGRLSETLELLRKQENLSLSEFSSTIRSGKDALNEKYVIPPTQADRLAQAPPELVMRIEELHLPPTTRIELNTASDGQIPIMQPLERLSAGQKATALLLLILLESDAPLIIDQPEDDLDNRFITEGVVPQMRKEKRRRQFIFATHNANIPVLGDAELIVGLRASGDTAEMPAEHMGSIDSAPVRELVEELLEGGKEAFEMRRLKYGF